MVLLVSHLTQTKLRLWYEADEYPVGAVHYLRRQNVRGNIALPLDWGGYVLWHTAPNVKVSLDGRFITIYPPGVIQANFDLFFGNGTEALRMLDEYPSTLILAPAGRANPAWRMSNWQRVYADEVAEIFQRGAPGPIEAGTAPQHRLLFP